MAFSQLHTLSATGSFDDWEDMEGSAVAYF
jgi:hypothetical protein